ncbi:hypothetical protein, partial [Streptomyces sp. NPDC000931]|uniref:hypothetical protein n=1 Tax=Streptomyces sp. NPDC000931 TaxID=3154372 RepID=UPI003329BD22
MNAHTPKNLDWSDLDLRAVNTVRALAMDAAGPPTHPTHPTHPSPTPHHRTPTTPPNPHPHP